MNFFNNLTSLLLFSINIVMSNFGSVYFLTKILDMSGECSEKRFSIVIFHLFSDLEILFGNAITIGLSYL